MQMRHTFLHNHSGTKCLYGFAPGRQLVVKVNGIFTAETAGAVASDLERVCAGSRSLSMVVDLSGAAVAMSEGELNATPDLLSYPLRVLPIAIVTSPAVRDLFREHAWQAAKLGLLRGVFAEAPGAHLWAHRHQPALYALRSQIPESAR